MIIRRIRVENFRMFGRPIELEFPEKGRIGIFGPNESGKTTLLQSMEYVLYGLRKGPSIEEQRENLVTWGKSGAKLEMEFSSGESHYLLTREFGAELGHRASLVPIMGGEQDRRSEITSITEIESFIEQLTGMDRDSFTKLIYIRQKDLDALRDLVRSRREQLLNKVIGIELFDQASDRVKADLSTSSQLLNQRRLELESVKANKQEYEKKSTSRVELERASGDLSVLLKECSPELEKAKKSYEAYEWLHESSTSNDLLRSKKSELQQLSTQQDALRKMQASLKEYEHIIGRDEQVILKLQEYRKAFEDLEMRIGDASNQLNDATNRRNEAIRNIGLREEEVSFAPSELNALKAVNLQRAGICIVIAGALVILGLLLGNDILTFIGLVPVAPTIYFFNEYLRADRLFSRVSEISVYDAQVAGFSDQLKKIRVELEDLKNKSRHVDSGEVKDALDAVLHRIKMETDQDSLEALKGAAKKLREQIEVSGITEIEKRAQVLREDMNSLMKKIEALSERKPKESLDFEYDSAKHQEWARIFEDYQKRCNELANRIDTNKALIEQIDNDLERLRADHERFPQLDLEVKGLERKMNLLDNVIREMRETGREIRAKVIPHASYIINQILPTITDGRYSDFEITEDLKFKVHSWQAGDYKEREVFSGGTQDQFLIALRLAFTQSILESRVAAEKYYLLMDECISSSDYTRRLGIFEVLEAMKGVFSQIFIISHEDISNLVDYHIVLMRNEQGYTEVRSKSW